MSISGRCLYLGCIVLVFDDPQKGSEGMEMGAAMNYPDDDAWDDFDDDDATDGGDE